MRRYQWLVWLIFFAFTVTSLKAADLKSLRTKIGQKIENGCVLLEDEQGRTLYSHQPQKVLVPASIVKILTSQAALDLLGKEFRFKTEFYRDKKNNLWIKGLGDPFLISEEIRKIAGLFRQRGLVRFARIFVDASAFEGEMKIPGTNGSLNPYDALNGALVVNFNTINVRKDLFGEVFSAEDETPLTYLARQKGLALTPGTQDRINLTDDPAESLRYAGELFYEIFAEEGIHVVDPVPYTGKVELGFEKILVYANETELQEVLRGLLRYSNNFIANQIFLTTGAEIKGYPASLEKSKRVFGEFIQQKYGLKKGTVHLEEASGISRKNRISCASMMRVLKTFLPHAELLHEKKGVLVKSGSLEGVYNYAGYFQGKKGLRPFVMVLNQEKNTRNGLLRLLDRLNKRLR